MPFWHILAMCLVPRNAGLNHIPSINDVVLGGKSGQKFHPGVVPSCVMAAMDPSVVGWMMMGPGGFQ
jgi:hypothetical protein